MYNMALIQDIQRYESTGKVPLFQRCFRYCQSTKGPIRFCLRVIYAYLTSRSHIEIPIECTIGAGLYIGHPNCITINPQVVIGKNCNIHKGATIGQENRGKRQGAPTIGNYVWIGINATIVGKITIGDDVLIAPNSYVNCDIPSHSIVFGNPCTIKTCKNATEGYINRRS